MVRLVFRPYTQVRRTICTSVSLRASTRVSSGFALLRHSSPSFGSQHICSCEGNKSLTTRDAPVRANAIWVTCAQGFGTRVLAHILDSLVRVSRRVGSERIRTPKPRSTLESDNLGGAQRTARTPRRVPEHRPASKHTDSLASNDFTCYLTLSPKCFSSFPHGTCSLSVSRQYLALDGYHHPLHAPFPRNATRRSSKLWRRLDRHTGLSPSRTWISIELTVHRRRSPDKTTIPPPGGVGLSIKLMPLHSPLLGQSLLVSFPPLNNMLKFSG